MKKLLIVLVIVALLATACVYDFGSGSDDNWCGVPNSVTDANCNQPPPNVPLMPTATQYIPIPPGVTLVP